MYSVFVSKTCAFIAIWRTSKHAQKLQPYNGNYNRGGHSLVMKQRLSK